MNNDDNGGVTKKNLPKLPKNNLMENNGQF